MVERVLFEHGSRKSFFFRKTIMIIKKMLEMKKTINQMKMIVLLEYRLHKTYISRL